MKVIAKLLLKEASTMAMSTPVMHIPFCVNKAGELKNNNNNKAQTAICPTLEGTAVDPGPRIWGNAQVSHGNRGWLDRNVRCSDPHQSFVLSTLSFPIHPDKTMKISTVVTSRSGPWPYFSRKLILRGKKESSSFIFIVENVS